MLVTTSTRSTTPWVLRGAAAVGTDEPGGVGVVDHHHRVVTLGEVADVAEPGEVSLHAEDAVGGDHPEPGRIRLLQLGLEVGHVAVGVDLPLGAAQPHAVDDAGVIERVADYGVLGAEYGLEQARIRVEARRVEDRVLGAHELAQAPLEVLVDLLSAADEPDGGHAEAVVAHAVGYRLEHVGMAGEAQVVVGAEVDQVSFGRVDLRPLGGFDQLLTLVETAVADVLQLVLEPRLDVAV